MSTRILPIAEPTPSSLPSSGRRIALWTALGIAEIATLLWFIGRLAGNDLSAASRIGNLLLDSAVVLIGIAAFFRRTRMVNAPLRRLAVLVPKVRNGEASIEELSEVGGQLAPVAAQFQELLRDLRQQRTQLDTEVRHRIASKTSALERAMGSLKQQASRDVLTGLFNRRVFDECLAKAIERSKSHQAHLSLLMIDVDRFKQLNDTLGHQTGDELLRSIAQIIRSTIRENDLAFRWGGDEFAVLAEHADMAAARIAAARMASLVDALGKTYKVAEPPGLSVGVATFHDLADPTAEAFLKAADQNLYQVKAARKRDPNPCSPASR